MEGISQESVQRLPSYLRFLKELASQKIESVSSTTIAKRFKINSVLVRKDLAGISAGGGKPKTGFLVSVLIDDISNFLGYNNGKSAILAGAGKLGSALLGYGGFENYGLYIIASFDLNPSQGKIGGKKVYDIAYLPQFVKEKGVSIGIITVPAQNAQEVCNLMVEAGIKAIWNFSPTELVISDDIAIKNEDMAASLAVLSQRLSKILKKDK